MTVNTLLNRLTLIGTIIFTFFTWLYSDELFYLFRGFIIFIIVLSGIVICILSIFGLLWLKYELKQKMAKSEVMYVIAPKDEQVYIRDANHTSIWRNAHRDYRFYGNGQYTEPTEAEKLNLFLNVKNPPQQLSLPSQVIDNQELDLLNVFTQPTQAYAIIGGQQTGKTYQARFIADYWLKRGLKPVVIGPKWDKGEWEGCIKRGGNGDYKAIERAIEKVRGLVNSRHSNKQLGHKDHPIQPIFFDDWTNIVDGADNARLLISEATTLYASVNIILYFIIHGDTSFTWGVDKKGAALKDNFIKLFIVPQYNENGKVIRELTKGYIRFAGETVNRPVKLFDSKIVNSELTIENKPLTEKELKIIEAYKQTGSATGTMKKVFNTRGGRQYKEVIDTLTTYGYSL